MNNHLDEGQLRAYLDGELNDSSSGHLAECSICQARLDEIDHRARFVEQHLLFLQQAPEAQLPRAGAALHQFKMRLKKKENSMLGKITNPKFRPVWIGFLVLVMVIGLFQVPVIKASAEQLLKLFRVQQVAVVPVDVSTLSELSENDTLSEMITQIMSDSITVLQEPGAEQTAASVEEASQLAGFTVRLPAGQETAPQLTVSGGSAYEFVIDRARAQAILDEAGHSDLTLPESLDGAKITLDIPYGVTAAYGECITPDEELVTYNYEDVDSHLPDVSKSSTPSFSNCMMLVEIPSPTVSAPDDLDLPRLAEIGLEFTGMTAEEAHAFSQSVDWTSSLVIPIPRHATTEEVAVHGVTGTLIRNSHDSSSGYMLLWVKDGVIYNIVGMDDDTQKAIDMANAMP
jgi:hypothetical protein